MPAEPHLVFPVHCSSRPLPTSSKSLFRESVDGFLLIYILVMAAVAKVIDPVNGKRMARNADNKPAAVCSV